MLAERSAQLLLLREESSRLSKRTNDEYEVDGGDKPNKTEES